MIVRQLVKQNIISVRRPINDSDLENIFASAIKYIGKTTATYPKLSYPSAINKADTSRDDHKKSPSANKPKPAGHDEAILAALDCVATLDAHLQQLIAVEAEEVEAESWNFDTLQQMIELTEKVGKIPFPLPSELYNLSPSGPSASKGKGRADEQTEDLSPSGPSASKGTGSADDQTKEDVKVKRTIFNFHPSDAQAEWWTETKRQSNHHFGCVGLID